jgi:transcriptional regulator NrdR family protein
LEELEEVKFEVDESAFEVNEGICKDCNEKLVKIIEDRNVGDWVTFHIAKLKCSKCGKRYLDFENANEYDLLLTLEKIFHQPIDVLSKKVAGLV